MTPRLLPLEITGRCSYYDIPVRRRIVPPPEFLAISRQFDSPPLFITMPGDRRIGRPFRS